MSTSTRTPTTTWGTLAASSLPNRQTSEPQLDLWNRQLRASPLYQRFVQQNGLVGKVGGWSRQQQADLERLLAANGMPIPSGMHIDQGGNLNQKNRLVRNAAITAGIAGAAIATAGAAGAFGGAAAGGSGAGAGAAGAGTAAGTAGALAPIAGGAPWAVTPLVAPVTASGVGAGTAAGLGAAVAPRLVNAGVGAVQGGQNGGGWKGAALGGLEGAATGGGGGGSMGTWSKVAQLAIPIAADLVTGYMGAKAAKGAAATQSASADRAMALNERLYNQTNETQRQLYNQANQVSRQAYDDTNATQRGVYNQQMALMSPYVNVGSGALSNAGQLVGLAPVNVPAIPALPSLPSGSAPQMAANPSDTMPTSGAIPRPDLAQGQPPGAVRNPNQTTPQVQAQVASQSGYRPGTLGSLSGDLVTVVSPDGKETVTVPKDQAEYYVSQGAKVVST